MPQYFTVDQARESLLQVRPLMEQAQQLKRRIDELQVGGAGAQSRVPGNGHVSSNGHSAGPPELERVVEEIERVLRRVQDLGCLVKDLDIGLVDWSHIRDDHEVYLCWHIGEDDIKYWHEIADGFRGRRPL